MRELTNLLVVVIAALTAAYVKIQGSRATKKMDEVKKEVAESREERKQQVGELKDISVEAHNTANGHNAKIRELTEELRNQREISIKQQSEILSLRRLQETRDTAQNPPQPQV